MNRCMVGATHRGVCATSEECYATPTCREDQRMHSHRQTRACYDRGSNFWTFFLRTSLTQNHRDVILVLFGNLFLYDT